MKTKELMLGDWINVHARFLEIQEKGNATSAHYNGFNRKACRVGGIYGETLTIDKICTDVIAYEPIPLTEEILKANGFETSSLGLVLYPKGRFLENGQESMEFVNTLLRKDGTLRSIEIDVFRFHFQCDYKLLFVHEFQHALRLCGLEDLADNFKIE